MIKWLGTKKKIEKVASCCNQQDTKPLTKPLSEGYKSDKILANRESTIQMILDEVIRQRKEKDGHLGIYDELLACSLASLSQL